MEQYQAVHRTEPENEVRHYGVKGMRWGVKRATKQLSKATSKEEADKAVAKLNKHKSKGTAKVQKLEKKHVQLEKDVDRHITKNDAKAAELKRKAARTRNKAYGVFVSQDRASDLLYKADKLDAKANNMIARSEKAKAKLKANEKMTELFKKEISNVDKALVDKGRRYINE